MKEHVGAIQTLYKHALIASVEVYKNTLFHIDEMHVKFACSTSRVKAMQG